MNRIKRMLIFLLAGCLYLTGCTEGPVARVGSEEISYQQAQLYLALTLQEYEALGGSEIWNMKIGGMDAYDAACEAALDSMIRNKTVLGRRHRTDRNVTREEQELINGAVRTLYERIGEEQLRRWGISRESVEKYIQEDYSVQLFLEQMSYEPDQEEVEQQVEEYFVWYDNLDVQEYMQRIWLDAIVLYSGQWLDGEWVEYSAEGQAQQYERALEAEKRLEAGESFESLKEEYSEEAVIQLSPSFTAGLVHNEAGNVFYKGQLERNLWEALFRIPAGETSQVLESQYGYLIVRVLGFPQMEQDAEEIYLRKLGEKREEYRQEALAMQIEIGIESIIDQWREETEVSVDAAQWQRVTEELRTGIGPD